MASANGVDLGTIVAMLHDVIEGQAALRRELKGDIADVRRELTDLVRAEVNGLRGEVNGLRGEVNGLRGEVNGLRGEVNGLRTEMRSEFADVRREIRLYHASVTGHGILITELEGRIRRLEEHLKLPYVASH